MQKYENINLRKNNKNINLRKNSYENINLRKNSYENINLRKNINSYKNTEKKYDYIKSGMKIKLILFYIRCVFAQLNINIKVKKKDVKKIIKLRSIINKSYKVILKMLEEIIEKVNNFFSSLSRDVVFMTQDKNFSSSGNKENYNNFIALISLKEMELREITKIKTSYLLCTDDNNIPFFSLKK
jgi:hypothetical protein